MSWVAPGVRPDGTTAEKPPMKIFKEKPGVISRNACWVCLHKEYLYTSSTLLGLLRKVITEWNHDLHLVG